MEEERISIPVPNRSRKRKGGPPYLPPAGIVALVLLAVVLVILAVGRSKDSPVSGSGEPGAMSAESEGQEAREPETEPTLSPEEQDRFDRSLARMEEYWQTVKERSEQP